jgi:hypothetical protein
LERRESEIHTDPLMVGHNDVGESNDPIQEKPIQNITAPNCRANAGGVSGMSTAPEMPGSKELDMRDRRCGIDIHGDRDGEWMIKVPKKFVRPIIYANRQPSAPSPFCAVIFHACTSGGFSDLKLRSKKLPTRSGHGFLSPSPRQEEVPPCGLCPS